jgi:RHS repeat-associated protein
MKIHPLRLVAILVLLFCFPGFAYVGFHSPVPGKHKPTSFYRADLNEGVIGFSKDMPVDNPGDNVFRVLLNAVPDDHSQAWLIYELYGVQDYTAVSRSINDEPSQGGYLVKLTPEWHTQKEMIPVSSLKRGINNIRFSVPENAGYNYRIRNLGILVENEVSHADNRELVLNIPEPFNYYQNQGYLKGFIDGKGANEAGVYVDGKKINTNAGSFEYLSNKPSGTGNAWPVSIVAMFADGSTVKKIIYFKKEAAPDYVNSASDFKTIRTEKWLSPKEAARIAFKGAQIYFPQGAMPSRSLVSVTALRYVDVPALDQGMVNVTKEYSGYRFLPHGSRFAKPVIVSLEYDESKIPEGYTPNDITTFYFDDKSKHWVALARDSVDLINKRIISQTTHFTDMLNGVLKAPESPETEANTPNSISDLKMADPTSEIQLLQPPMANEMGSAVLNFPIKIPAGRNGIEPRLAIEYNSEGGNSWLGLDWNLEAGAITIETRWGVPRYDPAMETETYVINGQQLSPVAHRSEPIARVNHPKQFYPRVEGDFDKIIRHGVNPANYWWEVTNKNGRRQFYGGNPVNGVDQNAVLTDANGNIAHWALTEVRDLNDNFIKYNYAKVLDSGVIGGTPGSNLYLDSITYTGHGTTQGRYTIEFTRDRELSEPKRSDISINGRWGFKRVTADLLRKISVKFNAQNIRTYELNYVQGAFYKTLLQSISEFDAGGSLFTTHSFEYYNDVQDTTGTYKPLLASEDWAPQSDGVKGDFINPIAHFGDHASMLGGNKSFGGGFGMAVTLGPDDEDYAMKTNTAGVNFGFNYTSSEGMLALVDINGDGLVDKVFKENGQLYFRPNRSGPSGTVNFGPRQPIMGINDFSKGETVVGNVGLESHFVIFAGFEYAHTQDISSVYFADVNGDQLMDIVSNGKVYFNHLDANGNPNFTLSSADTPSAINATSGIDPNLVTVDPQELEKAIDDNPLHDVVRVWVAPFTGTVSITNPVSLIRNPRPDSQNDTAAADGVKVTIQLKGSELWSAVIPRGDSLPKTPTAVGAVPVQKGDRIYFRVQSRFNGAYDQVLWSPEITYSNSTAQLNDANGLPIYQFNAGKDFLLSGPFSTGMSINGTIHIQGNFVKPLTSDDVTITIQKKSNGVLTTLQQQTFLWNQIVNLPISINQNVVKGDALFFSVSSNTNIDWAAMQWNPFVYYTASADPAVTTLFDSSNHPLLHVNPTVDFRSFNNTIQPGLSWTVPVSDTFTIQPHPVLLPGFESGNIVFSIKKQNQLLKKQVIPVTLGVTGANPPITLILNKDDKLFFEYYVDSPRLAALIISPQVIADADPGNPETIIGGLHTVDRSFIFGPLYRHWGQFAYNGNRDRANQPIIESDLALNPAINTNQPSSINLKNTSYSGNNLTAADSINQMQSMYSGANGYDPKKDNFIYLIPDNEKQLWIGYDNLTYVKKDTVSSSRMGKDDLLPVNPVIIGSAQGSGAVGIKRVSNTDNFSLAAGFGPLGGCTSFGFTNFAYDFMDMNGDRYPDILSTSKIQYTRPRGNLEPKAITISSGNEDVDKSEHFSIGGTLGGTFLRSNASNSGSTSKGAKAAKAQNQSEAAAGLSAEFNYNQDSTAFAMMDINGDDLPDRVYRNGKVRLNIGYSFLPEESWGYQGIRQGFAFSYGAGLGINISDYSIAAGIGVTRSENETNISLQDMNGDGLLDYVFKSGSIYVSINKGNGFAAPIPWTGADAIHKAVSTGESINGAFTIGIPIIPIAPVVKLCFNPSFNIAQGADRTSVQFEDINGDGFPDFLQSDEDSKLAVSLSNIKRTNKLKKVNRPLGASFTLDYQRVGNTYDLPNSIWALSDVEIFDGVTGDGADRMHTTFEYENGQYDRNEREFYGFGKVKTFHHDTENGDAVYRELDQEYINDNFYEKELVKSRVLKDAAGKKFTETINTYELKDIHTGATLSNSIKKSDEGAAFPALIHTQELFYEGQAVPGLTTSMDYAYDSLGNITQYTDFGDDGSADDVSSVISYHSVPARYIMNIPGSVTITSNGQVYRQRSSTIDDNTGNVTELRQFLASGAAAKYNMAYDAYGNMVSLTRPQNATGQRLTFSYQYDDEVQTYPTKISDSYGYSSSATYDVRFGKKLSCTDLNGQQSLYTIDKKGRDSTIRGPLEIASGQPFTIAYEYHPEAIVPWALTKHFDPAHPANFIETVSFTDGLGREVQTKKDGALFTGPNMADQEVMLVSGDSKYDAFGRVVAKSHPITELKGTTGVLNPKVDSVTPIKRSFDVLDRVLSTTLPDSSVTKVEYGFGTGRDGNVAFRTLTTDANGIRKEVFKDVHKHIESTKNEYRQGHDVWTSYSYNPVHELSEIKDDQNNIIRFGYDQLGRRVSVNHPDEGLTTFQYDLNGHVIEKTTANLQNGGGKIRYVYDQERMVKIIYPQNPQNNVSLEYGAPGAANFGAGRVIKQTDASGTQEFFFNPLGALVKNKRVINVPDTLPLTYITEWTHDTWNRLTGMVYPDGEKLTYNYNVGGLLQNMFGVKSGTTYDYLPQTGYDKFEDRIYMRYGNGTEMTYGYEPERRRLQKLTAKTAGKRMMLDNSYTYDKEDNILRIVNNAPVPHSNLMGGPSDYQYKYDDLYRLTNAAGTFDGSNQEDRYNLEMGYNSISDILSKNQLHERKAYNAKNWIVRNQTSYNYNYVYDANNQPHASRHIGRQAFTYDANGNQTGWTDDISAQNRQIAWDEENRIKTISDNGEIFRYTYDASGNRVLKSSGGGQSVSVNGARAGSTGGLGNYTVYVNPYMVVRSGGFTKHFYIEGQRIVSKLGESGNGKSNSSTGTGNGKGNGGSNATGAGNGINQEAFQFYYHSDHLGNTAFITDRTGETYQHLEYFPFGETFIDEHGNQERTPYLYNGKELDEETGLYYYGARYYNARTSVWQSVDPAWELPKEVNKSPYAYVLNNPLIYVDPEGRSHWNITTAAALKMIEQFTISDAPAAWAMGAKSGVSEHDVASYGVVKYLEVVGDLMTGDHQPSGAAVKEAIREALHGALPTVLTRSQAQNAYNRAVTLVVSDAWHRDYSRTYGGRNNYGQIQADAQDLHDAAEKDWAEYEDYLIGQHFSAKEIAKIKTRLRKAQTEFFKTGKVQFLPK